jgi:hypothetical protein
MPVNIRKFWIPDLIPQAGFVRNDDFLRIVTQSQSGWLVLSAIGRKNKSTSVLSTVHLQVAPGLYDKKISGLCGGVHGVNRTIKSRRLTQPARHHPPWADSGKAGGRLPKRAISGLKLSVFLHYFFEPRQ